MIKHVTSVCSYIRINYMWSIKNEQQNAADCFTDIFNLRENHEASYVIGFFFSLNI